MVQSLWQFEFYFQNIASIHQNRNFEQFMSTFHVSCYFTLEWKIQTVLNTFTDAVTKEKSQGSLFRSVLKCIPYLIEVGRSDKIIEIIPRYGISIDPVVREEAVQVLNRIVRYLPNRRFAVMKGMANFILQLPDEIPVLIQTSLGRLVELMRLWRACLCDEQLSYDTQNVKQSGQGSDAVPKLSLFQQSGEMIEFRTSEMDAVGLIFLCSVEAPIRLTALDLLRCVRALRNDIRDVTVNGRSDLKFKNEMESILIIDVLEENGVCIAHTVIHVVSCFLFVEEAFRFLICFRGLLAYTLLCTCTM